MPIFKDFLLNDKIQETLNKMDDAKCYAIQYKSAHDREFTDISTHPNDIYTLETAERLFRNNVGSKGTIVRIVKISRYLTSHGKLVPVSIVRCRTVTQ